MKEFLNKNFDKSKNKNKIRSKSSKVARVELYNKLLLFLVIIA